MPSISEELLSVLREVGSPFVITKPTGATISGEFLDFNTHTEHTNPSIRAFFVNVSLHHPTQVEVGDVISIGTEDPMTMLIMVKTAERFAGEIVEYKAAGFICNTTGRFYHQSSDERLTSDYKKRDGWVDLYPWLPAMNLPLMDRLYRSNVVGIANETMDVEINRLNLSFPSTLTEVVMGMRWVSNDGKTYKVDQIEDHNYIGVRVAFLSEETRR